MTEKDATTALGKTRSLRRLIPYNETSPLHVFTANLLKSKQCHISA